MQAALCLPSPKERDRAWRTDAGTRSADADASHPGSGSWPLRTTAVSGHSHRPTRRHEGPAPTEGAGPARGARRIPSLPPGRRPRSLVHGRSANDVGSSPPSRHIPDRQFDPRRHRNRSHRRPVTGGRDPLPVSCRRERRCLPQGRAAVRLTLVNQSAARHRIQGGTSFRVDGSRRGHWVRCSCGWESELCPTAVLAEAGGERHVEYHARVGRVDPGVEAIQGLSPGGLADRKTKPIPAGAGAHLVYGGTGEVARRAPRSYAPEALLPAHPRGDRLPRRWIPHSAPSAIGPGDPDRSAGQRSESVTATGRPPACRRVPRCSGPRSRGASAST